MANDSKPKLIGINHVALEVRDIEEELKFLERFFDFSLRSKSDEMAFIELGDQFIALMKSSDDAKDNHRHFGLVVDDKDRVEKLLNEQEIDIAEGKFLNFYDPSGNQWQIVDYSEIEFLKNPSVLRYLGCSAIGKGKQAMGDLVRKGIDP
ncbi:VOC family protein [Microbulbifer harenosus]|uniref:VOC family protein n=1 Tax=Microbulbifer harenosus TaxID=2576840 RepID=A0ABY2UJR9_9GAMM|nr:VOC family protein [Microbulbifer harenosus]TLM78144.1 VOC family protein [Microbulbifer harenosus]